MSIGIGAMEEAMEHLASLVSFHSFVVVVFFIDFCAFGVWSWSYWSWADSLYD